MSALARDAGLNRGNLYEALSEDGNPTLATLLKVARSLGLRLRLEPVAERGAGLLRDRPSAAEHGDFLYDERGLPK